MDERAAMQQKDEGYMVAAYQAGRDHGDAAGSWVVDGNTTDETKRALVAGIEDCDPMILDLLPSSPLSGEWADSPTPSSVLADLGVDEDSDDASDLLDEYERGFYEAVSDRVASDAR